MLARAASGLLLGLLACASGPPVRPAVPTDAPAADAPPRYVRVHLDVAKPGALEVVAGTRAEYRGWVLRHATPPGETPVAFLRVGVDGLWALRAARTWEEMPVQVRRDAEVETRVRAAVGTALDDNGARMHGNVLEHHNELLRFQAEASRGGGDLSAALARVHTVVVDRVVPAAGDAYATQAEARGGGARAGLHWVFVSSPGSGATVHLLGDGAGLEELPDAALVAERRVSPARLDAALGAPAPR